MYKTASMVIRSSTSFSMASILSLEESVTKKKKKKKEEKKIEEKQERVSPPLEAMQAMIAVINVALLGGVFSLQDAVKQDGSEDPSIGVFLSLFPDVPLVLCASRTMCLSYYVCLAHPPSRTSLPPPCFTPTSTLY